MIRISGSTILITRGDTAYISINVNDQDGNPYELQDGDKIEIHVRPRVSDRTELAFEGTVEYENDEVIWHIKPEDTDELEIDTYFYDVQLTTSNSDVFTIIPAAKFKILDEVTMHG